MRLGAILGMWRPPEGRSEPWGRFVLPPMRHCAPFMAPLWRFYFGENYVDLIHMGRVTLFEVSIMDIYDLSFLEDLVTWPHTMDWPARLALAVSLCLHCCCRSLICCTQRRSHSPAYHRQMPRSSSAAARWRPVRTTTSVGWK